jgi:glycosyltransferase involved in cell wall biosynthesis
MKILHYIAVYAPAWQFGGVVTWANQLCEQLAQQNCSVEVFTTNVGLENNRDLLVDKQTTYNGVKVTYFQYQKSILGIQSPQMEATVTSRIQEFDVLHISGLWQPTTSVACRVANKFNVPYVTTLHGALCPYSWSQKSLKKALYYLWRERWNVNNATAIHYTAQQEFEECRWLNLPGKPIIIPNGLDTNFWQPDPSGAKEWRQEQGFKEDEFLLLNVGRLHHKKGLDLLPPVLNKIRDLEWKIIFIGGDDDGTKDKLARQFKSLNLLDRVRFLPKCEPKELCAIYSACNLFVLPSRHENFGNVVIEALACGCPVMISDKVGIHREIQEAKMGWTLERNTMDWADKLRELLLSSSLSQEIVMRSREWVELNFSVYNTAEKMILCYEAIIH